MIKISIIIITYHTGPSLFDCIRAVLGQERAHEILLVDNGNPSDVMERLRDLAAQEARVTLLTGHGNIGFGRGVNLGAQHASGDYLLILNPDCVLEDKALEKLQAHAAALRPPFMIGARLLNEDGSDQRGCRRELLTPATAFVEALHLGRFFPQYRLNRHEEAVPETLSAIPAISGACMFLPRASFDLIKGFDEGFFLHVEDLDFCYRFRQAGGEIYFAPDVRATHLGSTSAVSSDFVERHKARSFVRYFHNNFGDKSPQLLLWGLNVAIWARYYLRRFLARPSAGS